MNIAGNQKKICTAAMFRKEIKMTVKIISKCSRSFSISLVHSFFHFYSKTSNSITVRNTSKYFQNWSRKKILDASSRTRWFKWRRWCTITATSNKQQAPMIQNFSTGKRAMIFGRQRILIPETVVRNKLQVYNICFHLIMSNLSQSRFWRTKKKRNNHVTL
jgi:hypothetical protein